MKTHLLDSSVPLTEGQDQTAICGANVKAAMFWMAWDDVFESGSEIKAILCRMGICAKCRKKDMDTLGRYIYLLVDGETFKQQENSKQRRVGEEA